MEGPDADGNTMFVNRYCAYKSLSPGIQKDIAERIFFPMISGRSNGSGLGLTIAQTAINSHQGIIECYSKPGDTIFSIYLPIRD